MIQQNGIDERKDNLGKTFGIVSFSLSLLSMALFILLFATQFYLWLIVCSAVCAITGLVFGIISRVRSRRNSVFGLLGLIFSLVDLTLLLILVVLIALVICYLGIEVLWLFDMLHWLTHLTAVG